MKEKDIMLISGYPYLTESTFSALNNIFEDRVYIYDPLDYNLSRAFTNYPYPENFLNSRIECSYKPIWSKYIKIPWLISIFISAHKWSRAIINDINKLNPKVIILITDIFPSSKIIDENYFNAKQYLLQPCLIDAWERKDKNKNKRKILNKLLNLNFFHSQQYWGLEGKNNKLCLYDHEINDFFQNKRNNIELIKSPMKSFFKSRVFNRRIFKKGGEKLRIGIFPVNYSSVHGEEYQKTFENKYKILCNLFSCEDVFVKIHPHDDVSYWKKILPNNIKILKDGHKEDLYLYTDVHISTYSYSSIESFYGGSYAINFQPERIKIKGDLENIFFNNCSLYSEDIETIVQEVNIYKDMNQHQKKDFVVKKIDYNGIDSTQSLMEVLN